MEIKALLVSGLGFEKMSTQNRRSSVTTTSSLAKRQAENLGKAAAGGPPHMAKKRPALANVTNQRQGPQNGPRQGPSNMVYINNLLMFD